MSVLFTRDAKVVISFTGLAKWHDFDTSAFISSTLVDRGDPERTLEPMRDKLIDALTNKLRELALPPAAKRLSLVFTGYQYEEEDPTSEYAYATGVLWRLSNFEREDTVLDVAEDSFELYDAPPMSVDTSSPYKFLTAGTTAGLIPEEIAKLELLLHERRPARALAQKALEIGGQAAQSPRSRRAIGTSWSVAIIPPEPPAPIWVQYYADSLRTEYFKPNLIDASNDDDLPILAVTNMVIGTRQPHAHGFPGTPRNAPCPCGSGKKYKRCHGRQSAATGGSYFNRLLVEDA